MQPIGYHKIGEMGKRIAAFLELPDPEKYTGHMFRATSATLAAEAGCSVPQLQQIGTWKSAKVASNYVRNSDSNRKKLAELLVKNIKIPSIENSPSTSGQKQETGIHSIGNIASASGHGQQVLLHHEINQEHPQYIPQEFHEELSQQMALEDTDLRSIPIDLQDEMSQPLTDEDFEKIAIPYKAIDDSTLMNIQKRKHSTELENNNNISIKKLKAIHQPTLDTVLNNNNPVTAQLNSDIMRPTIINNYYNCTINNGSEHQK